MKKIINVKQYLYYPGCSLNETGKPYDESLRAVFEKLEIPLMEILTKNSNDGTPAIIGEVGAAENGIVLLNNLLGTTRIINMLSGEQLPRIC